MRARFVAPACLVCLVALAEAACTGVIGANFDRAGGDAGQAADTSTVEQMDTGVSPGGDATILVDGDASFPGDDDDDDGGDDGATTSSDGATTVTDASADAAMEAAVPPAPFAACGAMAGLQANAPWPMEGACPARTNRSIALAPTHPSVTWRYDFAPASSSEVLTAPTLAADGTVYVVAYASVGDAAAGYVLFAFRNKRVVFTTPLPTLSSAPTIAADGTLYLHAGTKLLAVNPASGGITYTGTLTTSSSDAPVILDDGAIVVLDGGRMVFTTPPAGGSGYTVTSFTLPTSPAQTFIDSIAVSASGVLYAVAQKSGQAAKLLYGVDASALATMTNPITLVGDSDTFPQMDNDGHVVVMSDAVVETYSAGGIMLGEKTFNATLSSLRAAYNGTDFWMSTETKGLNDFNESAGTSKLYTSEEGALSPAVAFGDGSIAFMRRQQSARVQDAVECWTASGASRWTVALDTINDDVIGLSIAASGALYASYAHTLYEISD